MSSSTFEVRESESDSEKVIDFGLDTVEENGIMSTQSDGELPKDHTYTKEPDVLQGEETKESDDSSNKLEEMDSNISPPEKPKFSRAAKTKATAKKATPKSKTKKVASPKKESPAKKGKTKKDEIEEEISIVTEADDTNNVQEEEPVAEEAPAEEISKPAKRGRKRKIEEKENLLDQNSVEEPADSIVNESPKKRGRAPKTVKETKKKDISTNDTTDKYNLPKGWVRKTVVRKSGKSAGQIDVYIYSPDGNKFRSKPDIAAYLQRTKSPYNLDDFDFSKKKTAADSTPDATPVKTPHKKSTPARTKTPKKSVLSPKKSPKLLVKIVSDKRKSIKSPKKSAEKKTKAGKSPAKGRKAAKATSKGSKKK